MDKTREEKLGVAERHSWYIINSMMKDIAACKTSLNEAKQCWDAASEEDRKNVLYCSLQGQISYLEQYVRETEAALGALKKAGFN